MLTRLILVSVALLAGFSASAQPVTPESSVLATLNRFFRAMTERDTALMASTLVRDGSLHIVAIDGSEAVRTRTFSDYMLRLADAKERMIERYWDAQVRVDGPLATATMPYDFHMDGKFSHCGIDVFTLVLSRGVWHIASVSFTRQQEGCLESPLGPFKE